MRGDKLPGNKYKLISGIAIWMDTLSVYVDFRLSDAKIVFPEVIVTNNDTVDAEAEGENPAVQKAINLVAMRTKSEEIRPWLENVEVTIDTGDTVTFYWDSPNPNYLFAFVIFGATTSQEEHAFVSYSYPDNVLDLIPQGHNYYEFVNADENGNPILIKGNKYRWFVVGAKNHDGNIWLYEATTSEIFIGNFKVK